MATVHLLITGKVQGVFYRALAKEKARQLGVNGWIRNTKTGAVECLASGHHKALTVFVDWCKAGPPQATIDGVEVMAIEEKTFLEFVILKDE